MHKLLEYVCDELEELERKADKNGKLSMQEMQYVDTLAHTKKNLMKAEEMSEEIEGNSNGRTMGYSYDRYGRGENSSRGYSGRYDNNSVNSRRGSYDGEGSYARGGNSRGGSYTREDPKEELAMALKELKMDTKDQETSQMINRWIKQLEQV